MELGDQLDSVYEFQLYQGGRYLPEAVECSDHQCMILFLQLDAVP